MARSVTFQGASMSLIGRQLRENVSAPDFRLSDGDLNTVRLSDFEDKIKVITTFPSLDTPVCDLQVKNFNQRAVDLGEDVVVIAVSKDLPFAQKRFCSSNTIDHVLVFSDYRNNSFGANYGLTVEELNLLARSVVILDANNVVRYIQIVPEITNHPDYVAVYDALESVIATPALSIDTDGFEKCSIGDGDDALLDDEFISSAISDIDGCKYVDKKLVLDLRTDTYGDAVKIMNVIAHAAEEQMHHPEMSLELNKLRVTLMTNSAGGVTQNDLVMARIISSVIKG